MRLFRVNALKSMAVNVYFISKAVASFIGLSDNKQNGFNTLMHNEFILVERVSHTQTCTRTNSLKALE